MTDVDHPYTSAHPVWCECNRVPTLPARRYYLRCNYVMEVGELTPEAKAPPITLHRTEL